MQSEPQDPDGQGPDTGSQLPVRRMTGRSADGASELPRRSPRTPQARSKPDHNPVGRPSMSLPAPDETIGAKIDAARAVRAERSSAPASGPRRAPLPQAADGFADLLLEDDELGEVPAPVALRPSRVTAVVVSHDGERWLPGLLAAVAAQTRTPDEVLAADTGSTDGSVALLKKALGRASTLTMPVATGYGAAVAAALARSSAGRLASSSTDWVWLLHDDCAPEPRALESLLRAAQENPSAALLGPLVVDLDDPHKLVEYGLTVDRSGQRHAGVEHHEVNQGQYDRILDVLAVGTAGAVVRRDVWDALGGLDPDLPLFRDDVDLGWRVHAAGHRVLVVPGAVVRHARASSTGRRPIAAAHGTPRAVDRRNALFVLASNRSVLAMPGLVLAGLFRSLLYLITRRPHHARDEITAVGHLVAGVGRLAGARGRRRAQRSTLTGPADGPAAPSLLTPRGHALRSGAVGALSWLSSGSNAPTDLLGSLESGPSDDMMPAEDTSRLKGALLRPSVVLFAALAVLAVVAARGVLTGGPLLGGALYPAPLGAHDLLASWFSTWSPAGGGTGAAAAPYTPVLALLSLPAFGDVRLVVSVLLLGAVPLAGLSAYAMVRRQVRDPRLTVWAAVTWAVLPVTTSAVAGGRLDVAVGAITVPPLVLLGHRLVSGDPERAGWRRSWSHGLLLAVAASFLPPLWTVTVLACGLVLLAQTVSTRNDGTSAATLRRRWLSLAVVGVVPLALLLPWLRSARHQPGVLLRGLGGATTAGARTTGVDLALLHPTGPATGPLLLALPLVLAALLVGARRTRAGVATQAWVLAAAGLAVGVGATAVRAGHAGPAWSGPGLLAAGAGVVVAVLALADGGREVLRAYPLGWRQPVAAVLTLGCLAVPVVGALAWVVRGADGPVARRTVAYLPPDVAQLVRAETGARVLVVRPGTGADATVSWSLTGADGPTLGLAERPLPALSTRLLDADVKDLAVARGSDVAAALSTFGVRWVVLLDKAGTSPLVGAIDSQRQLSRRDTSFGIVLWQVTVPGARAQVLGPNLSTAATTVTAVASGSGRGPTRDQLAAEAPLVLPSRREAVDATVPAGPEGRLVVLSEAADPGWRATVDGVALKPERAWGWSQAFLLPAGGGHLLVRRDAGEAHLLVGLQVFALLVVLVLAAPAAGKDSDVVDDDDADLATLITTSRPGRAVTPSSVPGAGSGYRPLPVANKHPVDASSTDEHADAVVIVPVRRPRP